MYNYRKDNSCRKGRNMKNWNFHGFIALPLEEYGKMYIGSSCKTADEIEYGEFVNAMFSILSIKFGDLKGIPNFVFLCEDYADLPASKIPKEKAIKMYEEFERLIKQ